MAISKILVAVFIAATLIGCGTEKENRKAAENDKKSFDKNKATFDSIASTYGALPSETATEQDFESVSTAKLAVYKDNLEKSSKAIDTLLAIDKRGHVKIVNKYTNESMRKVFEDAYRTQSGHLQMVNARLAKLNALDPSGKVKPEALTETKPQPVKPQAQRQPTRNPTKR